jgi:putative tryptophan/tyrosine transport system substrate-binding protein
VRTPGRWLAIAIAAFAFASAGASQAAERAFRVGFLGQTHSNDLAREVDALRAGLAALGYEEGRNLWMDYRWADRRLERLPALARELVAAKADVIVTHGSAGSRAAKDATSTIPIVIAAIGDPVANGLVASLARPGGNVTGLVLEEFESTVKWLDFLKQVLPPRSRIGWLDIPGVETRDAEAASRAREDEAAKARGFEVLRIAIGGAGELPQAFERFSREAHAVIVPNSSLLNPQAPLIARLAATYRLPTAGSPARHAMSISS